MTLSAYQRECDELGSYAVTPGLIKAVMDNVETNVKQLDAEITASKVPDSFRKSWKEFVDKWRAFYQGNERWIDRLWCSTYADTIAFRGRLNEWRLLFISAGGQAKDPIAPNASGGGKPPTTDPSTGRDGGGGGFNLDLSGSGQALVIGGVAVFGLLFLIPLFKKGRDKNDRRRADQHD